MRTEKHSSYLLSLLALTALLGGCATGAAPENMVPAAFESGKKHPRP